MNNLQDIGRSDTMTTFSVRRGEPIKQSRVWGLGVIVGDRQKTVVRNEDRPRVRAALEQAAAYSRQHGEASKKR